MSVNMLFLSNQKSFSNKSHQILPKELSNRSTIVLAHLTDNLTLKNNKSEISLITYSLKPSNKAESPYKALKKDRKKTKNKYLASPKFKTDLQNSKITKIN